MGELFHTPVPYVSSPPLPLVSPYWPLSACRGRSPLRCPLGPLLLHTLPLGPSAPQLCFAVPYAPLSPLSMSSLAHSYQPWPPLQCSFLYLWLLALSLAFFRSPCPDNWAEVFSVLALCLMERLLLCLIDTQKRQELGSG